MTLMRDTTAAARRVQVEAFRQLDGPTRLLMACQMSDDSRAVTLSGIRHRHPDWSEIAVQEELLRLMLGRELAAVVFTRRRHR
jgi:hypothetical protein